jgi:hypothetical protein
MSVKYKTYLFKNGVGFVELWGDLVAMTVGDVSSVGQTEGEMAQQPNDYSAIGAFALVLSVGFALFIMAGNSGPTLSERVASAKKMGWQNIDLSDADERHIREGISSILRDSSSADYGKFRAGLTEDGKVVVCGTVNARNGFGGLTGHQVFYGLLTEDVFVPAFIDGPGDSTARKFCDANKIYI